MLARALARYFEVLTAEDGPSALVLLATTHVDAVLLDLSMPRMSGADVLARIREAHPDVEILVMAGPTELEQAAAAARAGAHGVVTKPLDEGPLISLALERAVERRRLTHRVRALEERLAQHERLGDLVAASPRMQDVHRRALGIAASSAPVLLVGERGTGKALLARVIHQRSPRADARLLTVSCGAVPESIIEEELFGAARLPSGEGRDAPGLFEAADHGTLFLDEIDDLPPLAQIRLLHALSRSEITRAGASEPRRVDVRIVAATHLDLKDLAAAGRFREDLAYRLAAFTLHVPPLRARKEDIPLLAHAFLRRHGRRDGGDVRRISVEAMRLLRDHPWPGNVGELEAAIQYAAATARSDVILPADLPLSTRAPSDRPVRPAPRSALAPPQSTLPAAAAAAAAAAIRPEAAELPYADAKDRALQSFDKVYVGTLLQRAGGNISEAARLAGMDRSNFRRLLKKAGAQGNGGRRA